LLFNQILLLESILVTTITNILFFNCRIYFMMFSFA